MAMKLYSDVSVQDIADEIRNINGSETTYKIRQMAPAIDTAYNNALDYTNDTTLSGTTNQEETITGAANLPIKEFVLSGNSIQTGTPTISNKIDVIGVYRGTIKFEDENENTKEKVLNFNDRGLYSLGDGTKDTIEIRNGHLYIVKRTIKIQLTSSMNWTIHPARNGAYCANFASDYGIQKLNYNMYCSHLTPSSTTWDTEYKFGWGSTSPNTTLWVTFNATTSEFPTTSAFKNWLDENNCYIIGKATTPRTIDVGTIENLFTYDGINYVTVTTNLGTTYELEYRQDTDSLIEQLEEV